MKIAYLTAQYPKVSHTFIRREILELERRGHEILRVSIRSPEFGLVDPADIAEASRTITILNQGALKLLTSLLKTFLSRPIPLLRELLAGVTRGRAGLVREVAYVVEAAFVCQLARSERLDQIHVHFGTNCATVARIADSLGGPPYSMTVHGSDEWDHPIEVAIGRKVEASRFSVAISNYTGAQMRRWTAYPAWKKIHIVHCSVDDSFLGSSEPIDPASNVFLCIGRLCQEKGQLILVEAFADLIRRGWDARLVLLGDGPMRPEVEDAIRSNAIEGEVEITGWVDGEEVRKQLGRSRCMVLPSFMEGLPVVIMEALALRRPVISTYIGGIPDLVRPGENGWLVPPADREALVMAMEEALRLPVEALNEMGSRGHDRVRREHNIALEVDKLEALLCENA